MAREPLDPASLSEDGRDPWDQQPGESRTQYSRFLMYLELGVRGTRRTLKQTVETLNAGDVSRLTLRTVQQLAYEYQWSKRAEAWDAEQFRLHLEKVRKLREEALERQRKLGLAMQVKATQALAAKPVADLSGSECVKLAVEGSRMELAALGEPTQRVEVSGPGGGPIQTEYLEGLTPVQRRERMQEVHEALARRLGVVHEDTDPDDRVD